MTPEVLMKDSRTIEPGWSGTAMKIPAVILFVLTASSASAQSTYTPPVLDTPAEQYAAASAMARSARSLPEGQERRELVLRAIMTLEPIPERWGHDSSWTRVSVRTQAQWFESVDDLTNAAKKYESLMELAEDPTEKVQAGLALAQIHRTTGNFTRASEVIAELERIEGASSASTARLRQLSLAIRQRPAVDPMERVRRFDEAAAASTDPVLRIQYRIDAVEALILSTPRDPSISGRLNSAENLVDSLLARDPGNGNAIAMKEQVGRLRDLVDRKNVK